MEKKTLNHGQTATAQSPAGDWWRNQGRPARTAQNADARNGTPHWPRTLSAKRQQPLAPEHLRYQAQRQRAGTLHCFLLDCSASMLAGQRLALAKGVLLNLLEWAYQQRAEVALIRFAGTRAELCLTPSRARRWNEDWLRPIGGGGGTPLASALTLAEDLLQRAARRQPAQQRWLWLMSDGRGSETPPAPTMAQHIQIVDCERQRIRLGRCRQLAEMWRAEYRAIEALIAAEHSLGELHHEQRGG